MKTIRILYFTDNGRRLADTILAALANAGEAGDASDGRGRLKEWTASQFRADGRVLVFIGAAGIAVRAIAPFVRDKFTDPAVIVIDEKGRFVIPILSGHAGEANEYARLLAGFTGGTAVITTATDVNGLFAVDVFARKNSLVLGDREAAKRFSSDLVRNGKAGFFVDERIRPLLTIRGDMPAELLTEKQYEALLRTDGQEMEKMTVCEISPFLPHRSGVPGRKNGGTAPGGKLQLVPRILVLGIGCRKGKDPEELRSFVKEFLAQHGLDPRAAAAVASIDLKKEEEALKALAALYRVPLLCFSADELSAVPGEYTASAFVERTTGVGNVCERAVMAAGCARLMIPKTAREGMTAAAGFLPFTLSFRVY